MGSMMDDINKYSKIWDQALEAGIFKDDSVNPQAEVDAKSDFFGNYRNEGDDVDQPLNENEFKHWNSILERSSLNPSKADLEPKKRIAIAMGDSPNPLYPYGIGQDTEIQKWDAFCEKLDSLADAKVRLGKLEDELNSIMAKNPEAAESEPKTKNTKRPAGLAKIAKQIEQLSAEIHKLSNLVTGQFGS